MYVYSIFPQILARVHINFQVVNNLAFIQGRQFFEAGTYYLTYILLACLFCCIKFVVYKCMLRDSMYNRMYNSGTGSNIPK